MAELLLELRSEEVPARMQRRAAEDLERAMAKALADNDMAHGAIQTFVTPRRVGLAVADVPTAQPDQRIERRGPRVDAPEKAVAGFLGSVGLTREQCEVRGESKGDFLWAVVDKRGRPAREVLAEIVAEIVGGFRWPKSMRDGRGGGFRWVRPLQSILAVFDGAPLDGQVHGIAFGDVTVGHRFLAPGEVRAGSFADYEQRLRDGFVMIHRNERRQTILEDANRVVAGLGLRLKDDPALIDEIAGLVEWPVVYSGSMDEAFLDVPAEILTTAMRTHQKYLAATQADGKLAPCFVFVANVRSDDGGAAIIDGNQRVLRARLSDAKFFWDQDRRHSLESRVPRLADVVFHAKLGTVGDKTARVADLAAQLCAYVDGADAAAVQRAARLAKADLVSDVVGEFPELQGVMGRYFAIEDGEDAAVAVAIGEHYAPQGPGDTVPTAPVSVAVALADKIDTLAGFWCIDEKPTGSKDPFALRRAALGVIRIVADNGLRVPLLTMFAAAAKTQPVAGDVAADLLGFLVDRLKVHLHEDGVPHDHVAAVFGAGGDDDLVRMTARVAALGAFLASEDGENLLTAYRRAANIVRAEEKKDGVRFAGDDYDGAMAAGDEATLWQALADAEGKTGELMAAEDFGGAMAALATLRGPVDRFFDAVTVNADDAAVRVNRLRLLARIVATMDQMADFSAIGGGK